MMGPIRLMGLIKHEHNRLTDSLLAMFYSLISHF